MTKQQVKQEASERSESSYDVTFFDTLLQFKKLSEVQQQRCWRIKRAVNSHDALVEALKEAYEEVHRKDTVKMIEQALKLAGE